MDRVKQSFERIQYIDIARGLGIFFVVLGHNLENEMLSFKLIYSFHVPLFFFLSGLCFNPNKYKTIKEIATDKSKKLLYPYFGFGFISMVIYCIFKDDNIVALKCLLFANRYQMMEAPFNVPMWYLPCLYSVIIIFYFCYRHIDSKVLIVVLSIGSIIGYTTVHHPVLPWSLDSAIHYLGYFAFGYYVKTKKVNKMTSRWICGISIFVFPLQLIYHFYKFPLSFMGRYIFELIFAFSGIFILLAISKAISLLVPKCWFCKGLQYLGMTSLLVLILHTPIRDWIVGILMWGITGEFYCGYGIRAINTFLSLLICIPFIESIKNLPHND